MAYVPDELLNCIVFVGCYDADGNERYVGSGFWVSRPGPEDIANAYRPTYLVTAAHVIDWIRKHVSPGDNRVLIRVNTKLGSQKWVETPLPFWKVHPDNGADLAVFKTTMDLTWHHLSWPVEAFVTAQSIQDDGRKIELGDELFFAGLFWPHTGEKRNIPIVRVGNVAALRGEKILNRDDHLMDAYLVESRSIGGLSGSPVFIDIHTAKRDYAGTSQFIRGNFPIKFRLLGVMHGHFTVPDVQPDADAGKEKIPLNMGIAIVVPSERILEVLEFFSQEELAEAEIFREAFRAVKLPMSAESDINS